MYVLRASTMLMLVFSHAQVCNSHNAHCNCYFVNLLEGFALNGTVAGACGDKGTQYVMTESTVTVTLCYVTSTNTPVFVTVKEGPLLLGTITFTSWTAGPQAPITIPSSCSCSPHASEPSSVQPRKSLFAKYLRM